MATTEELNKPPSLPPYPQMILEAIDALKQEEGANKTSISQYMESKHGEMPAGHAELLTTHLKQMQESGELLFVKNNYLRPGAEAPQKRGRGRPPKPKEDLPDLKQMQESGELLIVKNNYLRPEAEAPQKRGRGRPPKPKGDLPEGTVTVSAPSRGRGRPKKNPDAPSAPKKAKASATPPSGRPRGRPRKVQPQALQSGVEV